jgi:hypothetical protein
MVKNVYITDEQIALAKEKAKADTLKEYETMIGKRSRSFYEARFKAYCEAMNTLNNALA